jgi:hypothetical protein
VDEMEMFKGRNGDDAQKECTKLTKSGKCRKKRLINLDDRDSTSK